MVYLQNCCEVGVYSTDSEWQWHQLGHVQVCTLLQTDNHTRTPPFCFFTGRMPFLPPSQQRQSTVLCVPVCEYFVLMTIHRNILFDWCFVHAGNTGEGVRCEPGYWRICSIGLSRRENTEMCESIVATHYASNKGIPEVC